MPINFEAHFRDVGHLPNHAYEPGDDFYELLAAAHEGLSDEASTRFTLRLMLILANQVGDLHVLREAVSAARGGL